MEDLGWEELNDKATTLYHLQDKYADAIPLQKYSLEIFETASGTDHPDVATSLNRLAILFVDQGKYVEVEPLFERALKIRENTPVLPP